MKRIYAKFLGCSLNLYLRYERCPTQSPAWIVRLKAPSRHYIWEVLYSAEKHHLDYYLVSWLHRGVSLFWPEGELSWRVYSQSIFRLAPPPFPRLMAATVQGNRCSFWTGEIQTAHNSRWGPTWFLHGGVNTSDLSQDAVDFKFSSSPLAYWASWAYCSANFKPYMLITRRSCTLMMTFTANKPLVGIPGGFCLILGECFSSWINLGHPQCSCRGPSCSLSLQHLTVGLKHWFSD